MKKEDLKVGDRCKLYGAAIHARKSVSDPISHSYFSGKVVTIIESPFTEHGEIEVKDELGFVYTVHAKQLRRLKKKYPKGFWVRYCAVEENHDSVLYKLPHKPIKCCPYCKIMKVGEVK